MADLAAAQEYLRAHALDAWLVYDFHGSNPVFGELVATPAPGTRRAWLLVPAQGAPRLLVHHVDAGRFAAAGYSLETYRSYLEHERALAAWLAAHPRVAMEYVPQGALPALSRVDAGALELVRALGGQPSSSAELYQYAVARWSAAALASHRFAAEALVAAVHETFRFLGARLCSGVREGEAAGFLRQRLEAAGLVCAEGPIVAFDAHSGDPHYEPPAGGGAALQRSSWVLIDVWAKRPDPEAVYADVTWVGSVGEPTAEQTTAFAAVCGARDTALATLERAYAAGRPIAGWELDRAARTYLAERGLAEAFTHRLGHSLGVDVHGRGANLDDFETRDTRPLIPGLGFTVEPGLYYATFGVRSEVNVYIGPHGPEVTTVVQREIVPIAAP
jgi:Xaa-Pro aminopeptidase